jgi:preprotein translocase subunit SecF
MELIKKQTHIDFMGKFKMALIFSVVLILAGIVSIVMHGGLKYGIDFKGGTLVQLRFGVTMIPLKVDKPSLPIETINSKLNGIKKLKGLGLVGSFIQDDSSVINLLFPLGLNSNSKIETQVKDALENLKDLETLSVEPAVTILPDPPSIDSIRSGLKEIDLPDSTVSSGFKTIDLSGSTVQEFGAPNTILIHVDRSEIHVDRSESKLEEMGSLIKIGLGKSMDARGIIIERVEMVGPKVGKDLRMKALLSILYAIIGIVIYISWRFEFQYAIAAIIALLHDVLVTMGVFSVLDKEFTLVIVAAFLTIIGYSLNDTIVVFDRVRENTRRRSKESLSDVINTSINQTLSRTLLTSGTTLLVVVALFFLGGEIIHDFSFALLVGVVIGTYSSIFIASVFLVYWESRAHPQKA